MYQANIMFFFLHKPRNITIAEVVSFGLTTRRVRFRSFSQISLSQAQKSSLVPPMAHILYYKIVKNPRVFNFHV